MVVRAVRSGHLRAMGFQDFEAAGVAADTVQARVATLRSTFETLGVDGVIVPHEDAFQSEYLPPDAERLAYVTGFTGSAGRAVILIDRALLITDGRYALQARAQVPADVFEIVTSEDDAKPWLASLQDVRLGIDAELHTRSDLKRLRERVPGASLVTLPANPVDRMRNDRPAEVRGKVRPHPDRLAGRSAAQKLADVREAMEQGADAVLIASTDGLSWLLNWRGTDVAHTPLVLARAFVPRAGEATIFVHGEKLSAELLAALDGLATLADPEDYLPRLTELSRGKTVQADPARTSDAALAAIEAHGTLREAGDPTILLKAVKNAAEIAGMRAAHHRDAIAVTRFLAFADAHAVGMSEIDLVERLEAFRREVGAIDVSFDTIAGSGPNGAIVHYRVDRASNRTIEAGDPVLIDSGAQYEDGTTDITRTIVAGRASADFRRNFTRVLKGHIAIARQRFPKGTRGVDLDSLARAALWQAGLDYAHGTGHGVGAALAVHEGPQGISRRSLEPLVAGMILSNEPGYYREGAYGIRIENLVMVREAEVPLGGEVAMHAFQTLTFAPIDTRHLVPELMDAAEIAWLDAYHARVRAALSGDLRGADLGFLEARTRPMADR